VPLGVVGELIPVGVVLDQIPVPGVQDRGVVVDAASPVTCGGRVGDQNVHVVSVIGELEQPGTQCRPRRGVGNEGSELGAQQRLDRLWEASKTAVLTVPD
jgi:hypothetical protein